MASPWTRHDHHVAGFGRIHGRSGARQRAELLNQRLQGFRTARIAENNLIAVGHGKPRKLTT